MKSEALIFTEIFEEDESLNCEKGIERKTRMLSLFLYKKGLTEAFGVKIKSTLPFCQNHIILT
jgi:hypothetical protein